MALKDINTFVIVLMENRSFDHMLGYLSTAAINPPLPVEGLHGDAQWLIERFNYFHGEPVPIHPLTPATQSIEDPRTRPRQSRFKSTRRPGRTHRSKWVVSSKATCSGSLRRSPVHW
jgi:phospholipase C